jgi:hypothetical protein
MASRLHNRATLVPSAELAVPLVRVDVEVAAMIRVQAHGRFVERYGRTVRLLFASVDHAPCSTDVAHRLLSIGCPRRTKFWPDAVTVAMVGPEPRDVPPAPPQATSDTTNTPATRTPRWERAIRCAGRRPWRG